MSAAPSTSLRHDVAIVALKTANEYLMPLLHEMALLRATCDIFQPRFRSISETK